MEDKAARSPGDNKPTVFTCAKCSKVIKWDGKATGAVYWENDSYQCYECVFGVK